MGLLCFVYMICALRTNLVFFLIFLFLIPAFGCLAGAYWHLALGDAATATTLQVAAGACTFISDLLGWWIFFAILLASLDFPFQLPGMFYSYVLEVKVSLADISFFLDLVGDLSHIIKGASDRAKAKEEYSA